MATTPAAYLARFHAWHATHPALTLRDAVATFVGTLPPSLQRPMRGVLRDALGADALAWDTVPVARYHRDEARLRATVLSRAELVRLWTRAPLSTRDRALLAACFTLRRAEVVALRWGDVNLAEGLVYVAQGKGGRPGWTALPPVAVDALAAWARPVRDGAPISDGATSAPSALVFPADARGRAYHPDALGRVVRVLLRRAGLGRAWRGPHAFRRTFATTFLRERPGELRRLQVLMRHRQLATTVLYDYPAPADYAGAVAGLPLGA